MLQQHGSMHLHAATCKVPQEVYKQTRHRNRNLSVCFTMKCTLLRITKTDIV
uniref:Uncharacterized protein n=1 Tax=Octopus bimaculoides TaxID=37653 RepID=A0A0L8HJX2_OCTBM